MTYLLAGIAAVSLLVGGIGIMNVAGGAIGVAAAGGVFFGFHPARKAARLNPIEALRYE